MITARKSAEELWEQVLTALKPELKDETFDLWLKPLTACKLEHGVFLIKVPNRFFSDWIKTHFQTHIENILSQEAGAQVSIDFIIQEDDSLPPVHKDYPIVKVSSLNPSPAPVSFPLSREEIRFEQKYGFDNFVVGPSNRFAEAAAEAVAKDPGGAYNPLFIYGGVGLGKTHLLHSIGRAIAQGVPAKRVLYVPSEKFINEFIEAIRFDRMKDFRTKYRGLDCLLIDDIQFLMGKDSSQEEFFYTFNTLYESHKQIVICSDRAPRETNVGDRLISRFEWGVIADIQPPDLETRIAILLKKISSGGFNVPEDVVYFVANHIKSNIRELEGAITRIMACCSLTGVPLTVDTARQVLKDTLRSPEHAAPITIELVQKVVARHFNLELSDMRSKRRTDAIAFPRQVAMYLVRTLTEFSTPEIGAQFGGKDHTTVMHACSKIKNKLSGDPYFVALVNKITQDVREESLLIDL